MAHPERAVTPFARTLTLSSCSLLPSAIAPTPPAKSVYPQPLSILIASGGSDQASKMHVLTPDSLAQ